jgi:hypothetical protein
MATGLLYDDSDTLVDVFEFPTARECYDYARLRIRNSAPRGIIYYGYSAVIRLENGRRVTLLRTRPQRRKV